MTGQRGGAVESPPPRLREDLTVSRQQADDGTVMIVKDPVTGNFYRLGAAERFIVQQFDGTTPLEVIRQRTEEQFGASLPADAMQAFSKTLERAGLLETDEFRNGKRANRAGAERRVRGTLLRLRFRAFDPDRLFNRLLPWVRWCFTPAFLVLSAAVIIAAVATAMSNWGEVVQDLARLYRPSAIPLFMALIFLVVGAHEFAHGLTCKRFGGEVHEVGFMLIYFQPAFYCNVSDAWLFPEKSQRLWVSFAGPYFELVLWALATLTWRVTQTETWINYLGLIVMTSSGIKTLLNFNPFIKLDGYYLLSDYLDIPNLRRRAFRYVGSLIESILGFGGSPPAREPSPRDRWIYLGYGSAALAGTVSLLGYILVTFGGALVEGRQPLTLVLFSGYVVNKLNRRYRRLFGGGSSSADPDFEDDDEAPPTGNGKSKHAEPSQRVEKTKRKRRYSARRIAWTGAGIAALAGMVLGRMQLRIGGPFTILPVHNADVRSEIDGIVKEVRVTEGDEVRAGEVVARLSDRETRANLLQTKAQMQQAGARLRLLQLGPAKDSIALAETEVVKAEDQLKYARLRLDRNSELSGLGFLTSAELENSQEQADAARNEVAQTEKRLQALVAGARPEEIEATRADIARLTAQERYLDGQLQRAEVLSPAAGMVTTPARQLRELVGQVVSKGALIAKVFELRRLTVEIAIPEKEVADVAVGQDVALKAMAYPNETFHGTVTSIATTVQGSPASAAETTPLAPVSSGGGQKAVLVTTEIDNGSLRLKPGMTGEAKILAGERTIVALMVRRVARTIKVQFWSWW